MTTDAKFHEAVQLIRWARIAGEGLGITSAAQIAASLMSRAFISADISGSSAAIFSKERLAKMAQELVLSGQTFWLRRNGDIEWVQHATIARRTGNYRISGQSYDPSVVLHCRLNVDMKTGMGRSDLDIAANTKNLLGNIEKNLESESRDGAGYIIPTENWDNANLSEMLASLEGQKVMAPPESTSFLQSPGQSSMGQYDFTQRRVGFNPPPEVREMYMAARETALAVLGVPASLHRPMDASAMREGWRVYIFTVVDPIARLLEEAAGRSGLELDMNFDRLMASDIQNRSRAYGQLVGANMDEDDAARFTGLAG